MKTIPFGVTAKAAIGAVRVLTGERAAILLPLIFSDHPTETFAINLGSPQGTEIALGELRLAIPAFLSLTDDQILVQVAKNKLEAVIVKAYRLPQKNDATRYNVRLSPNLAEAPDAEVLAFLKKEQAPAIPDNHEPWGEPAH